MVARETGWRLHYRREGIIKMSEGKFKVVVQRPPAGSLFGKNAYEMEREALDPIGAEIVELSLIHI